MNFDGFLRKVEAGRKGENSWIPVKYKKMRRYLGIGRKMYYLIGGQPGTGKSSYVDTTFVINPYHWYKHNKDETDLKLKIVVRSMERSKEYRIAKWVSMKLFVDHGILIDVPSMFSWGIGETKITDDIYKKIKDAEEYFHEMEDVVSVIDGLKNPTGIYKQLKYWAESNGNTYRMKRDGSYQYYARNNSGKYKWIDEPNPPKEAVEAIKNPFERHYIPDDEDLIFVFVLDHIGKIREERGYTERQNLGKMSQYVSTLRDLYGMTPVVVCQFNRGLSNPQRRIHMQHQPEESDFKGAGDMYED